MTPFPRHVLILLLVSGLAGCAGKGAPPEETLAPESERSEPLPDIFGLVLDQDGERLANATVTIVGTALANTTGPDGAFAFAVAEPGTYQVLAGKEGHLNASTQVTIGQSFAAHIAFTLPALGSLPAEVFVDVFRGILPCTVHAASESCPGSADDDRFRSFRFPTDLAAPLLKGILLEIHWDPATFGPGTLEMTITDPAGEASPLVVRGEPGLAVLIDEDMLTGAYAHGPDLRVQIASADEAPVQAQQEFEVFLSYFLNEPAPDGYSVGD